MASSQWNRINTQKFIGFSVGVFMFALLILNSQEGFVFIVDHANLLFHEAGHPAVGLFSSRLEVYGGTLGQLIFPTVLAVSFWRQREPVPFAVGVIWFFENWLNISRYMADARAQELPLVGGGEHDWANIFGRWGLLAHDTQIAAAVKTVGWLGIAAECVWVAWRWWKDRASASGDVPPPMPAN